MKGKIQLYIVYKQYTKNIPKDMKQWKIRTGKTSHVNTNQNRVGLAIIIQMRQTLRQKTTPMDRECPNITTKVSTPQEDITILKLHITNKIVSNDINQKLTEAQREMDKSFLIVGDFNTPPSIMNRSKRLRKQNTSRNIVAFCCTIILFLKIRNINNCYSEDKASI